MQQIVVVHGGDTFATYEEYLQFLKEFEIEPHRAKGWKSNLAEALGEGYELFYPSMPNSFNAKYVEWKIWFEKYIPLLTEDVILLGHSLGGSFLVKYLSEEVFPRRIRATFIIAAPFDQDEDRALVEFVPPPSLGLLEQQGGRLFFYHSLDDTIVSPAEIEKYKKHLPHARYQIFDSYGHFLQAEFPEIVADIRSVA